VNWQALNRPDTSRPASVALRPSQPSTPERSDVATGREPSSLTFSGQLEASFQSRRLDKPDRIGDVFLKHTL